MKNKIRNWVKQYSQWFTPIIFLLIAVSVFLALFLNHTINDSHQRAQAEIVADALLLERTVDKKLSQDRGITAMLQVMMTDKDIADPTLVEMLADTVKSGVGYAALVSDSEGNAILSDGTSVSLAETDWFTKVKELQPGEIKVIHVKDDGFSETDAVICAGGISLAGGMNGICAYLDGTWIDDLSKTGKGKSLMTIVDQDGTILMQSQISDYFIRGTDYWKLLGENMASSAKYHITRKDNYAIYNATSGYTVVEIPIHEAGWAACVSVSGAYIKSLSNTYFMATRKLVYELVASVIVFFALLIILNTVSKIKRMKESQALGAKADHDALTGLRNKAATERDIQEYMNENPTTQSLLFILDIDDFKTVNDTMGHSFGDDVLHEFGFRLGSMFRASDIAGRIGGDEFMVFVKNIPNEDTIEKEAKKIREFIHSFRAGEEVKREITASSGAAVFPQDGADFETLYKAADKALYESKRSGKRQLSFFRH